MVMVIDGKKMCSKCKKFQSVENFYKDKYPKSCDGYRAYCKACWNKYTANYRRQKKAIRKRTR